MAAVRKNNRPLIRLLLARGADVNARGAQKATALHYAVLNVPRDAPPAKLRVVRMLLRHRIEIDSLDEYGQTPLMDAIVGQSPALVRVLLAKGANPNKAFGKAALVWSIIAGNRDEIRWDMLRAGADAKEADRDGETPLYYAAYRDPKFARALLEKGADPNAADKQGVTPLMNAVGSRCPELVRLLLDAGARVNDADDRGMTPLMYAMYSEANLETITMLIEAGADVNAEDKDGRSVLKYAEEQAWDDSRKPAIVALMAAGAVG